MTRLGILRAALLVACSGLIAACANGPAPETTAAPAPGPLFVIVERGQSLDQLSQRYHVPKRDIIAVNRLKPPYRVKPGKRLLIPPVWLEPLRAEGSRPKRSEVVADRARKASRPARAAAAPQTKSKKSEPEDIPLD